MAKEIKISESTLDKINELARIYAGKYKGQWNVSWDVYYRDWETELNAMVLTPPANGALLGSFKLQLDVFQIPMRLYNSWIHNNKLGIGTQMQNVKIPQLTVSYAHQDNEINADNPQGYPINNSHILKYLGISGGDIVIGKQIGRAHV